MIVNFSLNNDNQLQINQNNPDALKQAVWIDALAPSMEERKMLQISADVTLPLHNELYQLEFSNRFYQEKDALYLSLNIVTKAAPMPESHIITLILSKTKIITLRYCDLNIINVFTEKSDKRPEIVKDSGDFFLILLKKIVGTNSDFFELIGATSDILSVQLGESIDNTTGGRKNKNLSKILSEINFLQTLLSKCNQSLTSLSLLMSYLNDKTAPLFNEEGDTQRFQAIHQDIQTLHQHGDYLIQKLEFQLDSTLGLINMEQTYIIKMFTILAMVFMPPTLLASIYGMNFKHIPELSLPYGYPIALCVMAASALLPYRIFKAKGWI